MRLVCKSLLIFFLLGLTSFAKGAIPAGAGALMKATEVHYDAKKDTITARGDIFIQMDNYTVSADKIHYRLKEDEIFAEGNIKITDENNHIIHGERAIFKDKLKRGVVEEFIVKFDQNSILVARLANRLDDKHITLDKAVFTPCEINCGNKPIWQLSAGHTNIDYEKQKITYKHVFFEVYGVPIMYLPYFRHPTPSAPAQSGILAPKIKQNDFILPFYFRPKSNLDFTISPRLAKNYTIFEGELRHKVKLGQYEVHGSYGNPSYTKTKDGKMSKNSRPGRYHVFSKGDFSKDKINYGFDIKRASDKAYLINYHEIYDSYLTSSIYTNTIDGRDYFALEGFAFQDLRSDKVKLGTGVGSKLKTPFILPSVRTQNIYSLNDAESLLFNVRNNTIAYNEPNRQLARTSLDLELMNNLITNNGHMMSFTFANRGDLYWTNFLDPNTVNEKEKIWYRNIPEFRTRWRYPLAKTISNKSTIVLEPTAMVVLGKKYEPRFKKFELVDPTKNELSENNIFNGNSFSGIDAHDYGNRFSYGLNSSLMSEHLYVNTFLGQLLYKDNAIEKGNADYVGNISVDVDNSFELYYRFRKNNMLKAIRDEVGMNANFEKLTANAIFTELHNVSQYFAKEGFEPEQDKASQLSFNVNYLLRPNLWIGASTNLDVASTPVKVLVRSIRVTYLFDCVSINGAITDNFLQDSARGVKKTRSKTFSVGLKVINM
ncbi:MAG: LPS assembly protein LptD [Rickettsiaceae bacterium]|nr:LPS assembly protein LptD [Rickettsiaceae bacterium]